VYQGKDIGMPQYDKIMVAHNYGQRLDFVVSCDSVPMVLAESDTTATYIPGGTSNAAPQVAATIALLMSKKPSLTFQEIKQLLKDGATDLKTPGFDIYTGWGRINAEKSLELIVPPANAENVK
jgi:thermitase